MKLKEEINNLKINSDKNFNYAICFTIIVLFLYCYFGSFSFFEKFFNVADLNYWKIIYHNFMAFILFFVIGLFFTKFILKTSPKYFYLQSGNWKTGLKLIGIATIIVPLIALTTLFDKEMTNTYPLIDFKTYSAWWQILLYFLSYLAYYVGWEYLFRGILLKSSEKNLGIIGAILLTTLISSIIHTSIADFGKPMIETLSAIPAGLIFGYITTKTNSLLYSLYIHMLVGFLTDLFIFFI